MKHELDEHGEPIHVDVDEWIPTGICSICADVTPETVTPENRG